VEVSRSDHKICEGMTPIMIALNIDDGGCNPNPECIRTMVRLGSDCNTQAGKGSDKEGLTAFEMLGTPDTDPEVWHENRIQVYAPHQRYRKFPHTAVKISRISAGVLSYSKYTRVLTFGYFYQGYRQHFCS